MDCWQPASPRREQEHIRPSTIRDEFKCLKHLLHSLGRRGDGCHPKIRDAEIVHEPQLFARLVVCPDLFRKIRAV